MSQDRNLKWLNDKRIVYRRDPTTDVPTIETDQYKYYEDGTYQCYHLFNSKAKITTYKSLKWHMLVLYYLNEDIELEHVFRFIANKDNGFVTFFIKQQLLDEMIKDGIEINSLIEDPLFVDIENQNLLEKNIVEVLENENVAYDIGSYRSAPPGLRIWGGPTINPNDIKLLLPWLQWAYEDSYKLVKKGN